MQDFQDVLKTRRSVRSYTPEKVSDADLRELIDLAVLAPTGMNAQPWAFSVVTNREVMQKLNAIVLGHLRSPEMQEILRREGLKEILDRPDFDIFYGAPALIVITGNIKAPTAMTDCQLAAENLFLAAHARSLGSCYMGFLGLASKDPAVRDLLKIQEENEIMAAAVVGHPNARPEGPPQRNAPRIEWIR